MKNATQTPLNGLSPSAAPQPVQSKKVVRKGMRIFPRGWLTVLAYHRVVAPDDLGTNSDHSLVSADTVQFAAQMNFVHRHFNVIGIDDLLTWLAGHCMLPDYPLLITFDDGYRDNYQSALPILRDRNLPALLFIASDCIESSQPFYWDLLAYCFNHTKKSGLNVPMLSAYHWNNVKERSLQRRRLLNNLKRLPEVQKRQLVDQLPEALDVTVPTDAFSHLYLNWDQVRALVSAGVDIGGHTASHPILSRIPLDQAESEITESKNRIEAEIGQPLRAFAYPNGLCSDFNPSLDSLLEQAGFEVAFSLLPGPMRLNEIKRHPLRIRRLCINGKDTLPRFIAKLVGTARLLGRRNR